MPCPFALTAQLLYGGIGDAIALTATAPLSRIALILQTEQEQKNGSKDDILTYGGGVLACGRRLVAEQGVWSLWRGNAIAFGYTAAFKSLSVYFKGYFLKHFSFYLSLPEKRDESSIDPAKSQSQGEEKRQQEQEREANQAEVKAGVLAGCAAIMILYPINYALTCISTNAGNSNGVPFDGSVRDCIIQTMRSVGIFNLYKGLGMMLASFLNYQILYLDLHKRLPVSLQGSGHWKRLTIGQVVGVLATCLSYPLETISRRLQVQTAVFAIQGADAPSAMNPNGLSGNLYSGITVRLVSGALQNGILSLCNSERSQDLIRKVVMKFFH